MTLKTEGWEPPGFSAGKVCIAKVRSINLSLFVPAKSVAQRSYLLFQKVISIQKAKIKSKQINAHIRKMRWESSSSGSCAMRATRRPWKKECILTREFSRIKLHSLHPETAITQHYKSGRGNGQHCQAVKIYCLELCNKCSPCPFCFFLLFKSYPDSPLLSNFPLPECFF